MSNDRDAGPLRTRLMDGGGRGPEEVRRRPDPVNTGDFDNADWEQVSVLVWHGMNRVAAMAHVRRRKDHEAR